MTLTKGRQHVAPTIKIMKQCIKCFSENISTVMEKDHLFYYCSNCREKNSRIIDHDGNNFSTTENNLIKHTAVGIIIEKNNKILLIKRQQYPYGLGIPACHIHHKESIDSALTRLFRNKIKGEMSSKKIIFNQTIIDPCRYGGELHEWSLFKCNVKNLQNNRDLVWILKSKLEKQHLIHSAQTLLSRLGYLSNTEGDKAVDENHTPIVSKNKDNQSILNNLPIAIMSVDETGNFVFQNTAAKTLLENIKPDSGDFKKFSNSLLLIAKKSIESKSDISSNIKYKFNTYNIMSTYLQDKNSTKRCVLTIRDITDQRISKARDVLAYQTSMTLSDSSNYNEIIKTMMHQLFYAIDITGCSLMVLNNDKLKVTQRYSKTETKKRKPLELNVGEGVAGWVAKNKTPMAIPDTSSSPIYVGAPNAKSQSILSVPVMTNNTILGVVSASKPKNFYFTEDEMKMVTMVANRIALATENQNLFNKINGDKKTFETVLSTTSDGLILLNKNLELIFANPAAIAINQLTTDEVKNHHIKNFIRKTSDKNIKKFLSCVKKSINLKERLTVEFVSAKGPVKIVRSIFNPIIDNNGKCDSVLIGFNNITKEVMKGNQVQEKINQMTTLLKISSIFYNDIDDFINKILSKTKEIIGSEEASVYLFKKGFLGKKPANNSIEELLKSQKKAIIKSRFGILSNNAKKELLYYKANHVLIVPLKLEKQIVGCIYVISKNSRFTENESVILNIIASRIALRLSSDNLIDRIEEDRLKIKNIVENTADGIVAIGKRNNSMVWNKAAVNITGFNTVEEYFKANPETEKRIQQSFTKTYKNSSDLKFYEKIKILNADNQHIWINITISVLAKDNGKAEYVIGVFHDATKEIDMENKQKEFIYTATHELRTPITAIKGYLSMILGGDTGKIAGNQRLYIKRAYSSTERLVSLVEDLLQVSRMEEDKTQFKKEIIDVKNLITETCNDYYQKAKDKGVEIKILKNDNIKMYGDYNLTKHALANLVDNAIKYTKKGAVEISFNKKNDLGYVSVKDTGVGIPRRQQSAVFDKFHRVFNSESIRAGGTGLGLFIVKNLIEKQGGKVSLSSKITQGSTFKISLPLVKNKTN